MAQEKDLDGEMLKKFAETILPGSLERDGLIEKTKELGASNAAEQIVSVICATP